MKDYRAAHVTIRGKVQGVWFRAWTSEQAERLGLSGWVRNRRDGRVEAVIAGPAAAVQELLDLFWEGPPLAKVAEVESGPYADPPPKGFEQRESV